MSLDGGMMDPHAFTRILFQDFPSWEVSFFYLVGFAAIGSFIYGVYREVRKYLRGVPDARVIWDYAHIKQGIVAIATHRTLVRRDPYAGMAHRAIFYGFGVLFMGTSIITLEYDITSKLFGIHYWYGDFYLWFKLAMNIAGVSLVGGLIYMMVRRGWIKPPKLDYARPDRAPDAPDYDRSNYRIEDWLFLWILVIIGVSGFVLSGARMIWLADRPEVWDIRWWSPVGAFFAYGLRALGLDAEGAVILRQLIWWSHGALALTLISLIPYTKAKHIFTAIISLVVRDPLPAQRLPKVPEGQEQIGYRFLTDMSWKQLLHLDACTKCGRCHEACPARTTGGPLSPRDVILSLRELANSALQYSAVPEQSKLAMHGTGVGQVSSETLWACRTCMACVEICPVAVEHVPIIVQMRRALVEEGDMDPLLQKTLQTIHKSGNSFGESRRKRGGWAKGLPFPVKDARKEPVDVLWFVGDYASFDPRNQKVSQAFARLMHAAGIDFGILYDGESNAGNDIRRVGEEGLYEHLAESNISAMQSADFNRVVTTDPHSFNTIKNEYPDFGGQFEIEHYTSFVMKLIEEGRLTVKKQLGHRVTFHDPCHLGRFNKGYDAPRKLLEAIGCELVEMKRCKDNSFCCGAGGGRIWVPDPVGTEKPAQNRMREAASIEGLEVYVVSCPKDLTMFEDALKTTGYEGKFVVRELLEMLEEALEINLVEAEVTA
jgi:Fe-S oxidoreductase